MKPSPPLPPGWWQRVRHDLRSAVAPARMAVQLLRSGRIEAKEREEALQVIDRQLELLLAGIDDIGELMRVQAGSFAIDARQEDANLLLDVLCGRGALMRGLAERGVTLRCHPCEAEALVGHDSARVAALLEYVLMRAAAHARPGTELVLSLRNGDRISLHLSGAPASLAADAELQHLLGGGEADDEPSLRTMLMREFLRAGAMQLEHEGEGALALRFATPAMA